MNLARFSRMAFALAVALGGILANAPAAAQREAYTPVPAGMQYVEHELRLPVPGSGAAGLDALEVYVNTPGKHPLALITHGTSNSAEERKQVTPWAYLQQAVWFAQRGYVALVIVRRGYGNSGGEEDGARRGCNASGTFEEAGEAAADDLRSAVDYAQHSLPEADATRVISSGVSTGGFSQVALTAHPPRGLETAISFAGGRGGDGTGHLCDEGGVESALHDFGKRSHTPMLWIYAENDKWFPPNFARRFLAAYQSGGGSAQFILAPPFGQDGHGLFSDPRAWSDTVESYLSAHGLLPVNPAYPPPAVPHVDPPAGLGANGLKAFEHYLTLGRFKAFATNGESYYGTGIGQFTQELADQRALDGCNKVRSSGGPCYIAYRGDSPASGKNSGTGKQGAEPRGSGRTGP